MSVAPQSASKTCEIPSAVLGEILKAFHWKQVGVDRWQCPEPVDFSGCDNKPYPIFTTYEAVCWVSASLIISGDASSYINQISSVTAI